MADKEILRSALCGHYLGLDRSDDSARIFAEVDSFVTQSQGNDTIEKVTLLPYDVDPGNYERWDKVGQGLGNLKSLRVIDIGLTFNNLGEPDWEILARILPHIQSKITLQISGGRIERTEEMRAFATAMQGHPAITQFESIPGFSFENTATLCSALTTLPNLESAVLRHQPLMGREILPTFRSPESMTEFLRSPSLRIVKFRDFCFTSLICQATAIALKQGSSITSLVLYQCSFPEGGSENIASALEENTTLTTFEISPAPDSSIHQAFYDAMAASLLSNSTLQELVISYGEGLYPSSVCVSFLLWALGMNKTLRKLRVSSTAGGSVIAALREALGQNSTLEILELTQDRTHDEADVTLFRIAVVEALQLNKTLKTLRLCYGATPKLTDDEVQYLTSVVKKNYGLESLPDLDSSGVRFRDLRSILRLNRAGRGYLKGGHGSVVSKGIGVLNGVSDDVNCVFLHLLENPSLCNTSHY
jgi:hypothetical protein